MLHVRYDVDTYYVQLFNTLSKLIIRELTVITLISIYDT